MWLSNAAFYELPAGVRKDTGGSTNNAHDAVATMEIIIKQSTCNDLWAGLVRPRARTIDRRQRCLRRETILSCSRTRSRERALASPRKSTLRGYGHLLNGNWKSSWSEARFDFLGSLVDRVSLKFLVEIVLAVLMLHFSSI